MPIPLVRAALPLDVAALLELEAACFADAWTMNTLQSTLDDAKSLTCVAQVEQEIAGYASGWTIGDEGEVTRVAVHPHWRGRGFGRNLLQHLQEESARRGARTLFLEVRESNVAALQLYRGCGWIEVGRRKRYYADGEDALVMRRDL